MVLDNLEMFRQKSGALPWHLKFTQGSSNVVDTLTPSFSVVWPMLARTLGISGSREWNLSWTVVPTIDPGQLQNVRTMYLCAIYSGSPPLNLFPDVSSEKGICQDT
jgi:hypothetical protein